MTVQPKGSETCIYCGDLVDGDTMVCEECELEEEN